MSVHKPVLLKEVIEGLDLAKGDLVVDATFGGGGHSMAMCRLIGANGKIIGFDADAAAITAGQEKKESGEFSSCQIDFVQTNFRNIDKALAAENVHLIDKALFDFGLSSDQLESSGRGFTFLKDEPLIMTLAANPGPDDLSARQIVNEWSEESLADIIYGFGGERYSRRIARKIIEGRTVEPIETTFQFVDVIGKAVPADYRRGRIHFATKTFQAIRIATNDELGAIRTALSAIWPIVKTGGRVAAISFHELEDRIVKLFFRDKANNDEAILITKKPIIADDDEMKENPRSRSAKLRVIQKK
ncbi:MAG: 16S rRNA (cytosine(1402)-N(4))-methyltransferase RsmH [Candidatus Paceibacterota bacterium]|jgi:16S rRNA (cytosine1402-N4)-methyltransferase